jgi:hypothetical protein
MKGIYVFLGILGVLVFLAILTVVLVYFLRKEPNIPVTPTTEQGTNLNDLPEISGLPCCVVNGVVSATVYVPFIDAVVSTTPTAYLAACQPFAPDGITPNPTQYDLCIAQSRPTQIGQVASPVARKGVTLYYTLSAGNALCATTGTCRV